MNFLRQKWKQKPAQWGPYNRVQSSLFHNLESIYGIDHQTCALALPCWGPGDQINYGNINITGASTGALSKNALYFTPDERITFTDNIFADFSAITVFSSQKIISRGKTGDFWQLAQTRDIDAPRDIHMEYRVAGPYDRTENSCLHYAFMVNYGWRIWDARSLDYSLGENFTSAISYTYGTGSSIAGYINGNTVSGSWKIGSGVGSPPTNTQNLTIGSAPLTTQNDNINGNLNQMLIFSSAFNESKISALNENPNALWQRVAPVTYFMPMGGIGGTIFDVSCLDSFNLNDSISRNAIFSAVANETLSLSSSPGNIGNFLTSALSQIAITGVTSTRMIMLGNVADSISITDAANALSSIVGLVSDSVNLSDSTSAEGIFQGSASDSASFADAVVNSLITQGIINEIVNLSDATSLGAFIDALVNDQITLSDGTVNVASLVAAIQDNVNLSDSVTAILQALASASDTIILSDLAAWGAVQQALASSGLSLTDSAAANLHSFAQSADSITFNDASHMTAVFNVTVTDAVSFAETISKIALFQASVADSARFSATAMEVSTLPNGKVTVSFDMKIPGVGFDMKIPGVGVDMKTATITFNLI